MNQRKGRAAQAGPRRPGRAGRAAQAGPRQIEAVLKAEPLDLFGLPGAWASTVEDYRN